MENDQAGQWLTYGEAGRRFGVTPEAARQLARRRGWPRRTPNEPNETARIFVPDDAYVRPRTPVNGVSTPVVPSAANGLDRAVEGDVRVVELAIAALTAQLERRDAELERRDRDLERERRRGDDERRLYTEERERSGRLQAALADAVAANQITAGEASGLRAELDRRRQWRLWRRLRWALRGD